MKKLVSAAFAVALSLALLPTSHAASTEEPDAQQGCCSHHGGVCGCSSHTTTCCDGSASPSCHCRAE